MKESDLYIPVRDWLTEQGYTVHVEIFDADIVAVKDGKLTVVELKVHASQALWVQCHSRMAWADYVLAAVPMRPKDTRDFRNAGIGMLLVDGAKVRQIVAPKPQPWGWHKKHAYRLEKLAGRAPAMEHERAGLPSCSQLREQRRLRSLGAVVASDIEVM